MIPAPDSPSASSPLVSVIMPAHEARATIAESAASALAQTLADIELLVSDDGSREPVCEALAGIADPRLRVLRREHNRGVSAARNLALYQARAPLVAQLDADDLWLPDHLERLVGLFEDEEVGLAYSNARIEGFPRAQLWIAERTPGDGLPSWIGDRAAQPVNDMRTLYRGNPIPAPGVVMRTAAARAAGGYPEWLRVGEEYYLYLGIRRGGWRFAYSDAATAVYRWPEPGRGVTLNARRNAREEAKLFAVLSVTSHGDPAVLRRLGYELVDVARTHLPGVERLARRAGAALKNSE